MKDTIQKEAEVAPAMGSSNGQRARVFISYKRDVDPDESIAEQVYKALSDEHEVFIDQTMLVGTRWAERIEEELCRSDFLITFLSATSIHSEMLLGEVETAHRLYKDQDRPAILPVRLNYKEAFKYPLSAYLNAINWAFWEDDADTPRLIEELKQALAGGALAIDTRAHDSVLQESEPPALPAPLASAQPLRRLESPEGTMDPQSDYYVERPVDHIALNAIERQGVTITLKGPRQMGKSSLLMRTMQAAAKAGKHVVFLDFQLFDEATLRDADTFFRQFCTWLTDELEMEDRVDEYWQRPLGHSLRCTRYVDRYLLKELDAPLVLAMDEVECVFDTDFRTDFFSMLRNWHNERAKKKWKAGQLVESRWKQLDLVLVTSTEPYQLIDSLNQSPFNVGEIIELTDFEPEQVAYLNRQHGSPLSKDEVQALIKLLGGHPYLTRRALYLVASGRISMAGLEEQAIEDRGPFGDHLRYHFFLLRGHDELIACFTQILRQRTEPDEEHFWRLRGAGLVRRLNDEVVPRCQLYADYFRKRLDV